MRRLSGLLLSLVLLLPLTSCEETGASPSPSASPSPAVESAAVEFALPRTDSTLNPILGSDRTNLALAPLLWEGLFELDNTFTPQNVLCERESVSQDGLVWTFTLRSGVTFSDGTPLTSAEAVQSLQLALSAGSRYADRLSGISAVTAPNGQTVAVTLTAPNGSLPALLDIPIIKGESEEPLGTGPYVLEGWGENAGLVRRSGWWQGKDLPLEASPLRAVNGADNLIYAFDTNDISLVTTDLTGTNALGYSTGYEAWDCPTTIMLYVGFNTAKGPCADALLRQAVSRSFDRSTVAASLYARHLAAAALPLSPSSPLYDAALAETLGYSAQDAAGLYTQAGYTLADGVLSQGRHALSLTFLVNNENSFKAAAAEYLAGELEKAGVTVALQKLNWADYEKALKAGSFDLYLGETMLTADFNVAGLVTRGGALNYGKYDSAETAALLNAFQAASGDARTAAAAALCARLGQEVPFAVLGFKNTSALTQWGQVSGLSPTQSNAFFALSGWTLSAGE